MAQNNGFYGDAGDFPGNSNQNGFQAPPFTASPGPGRQYSPFPQQSQTPGRSGVDSLNDMQSQHGIFHEPMPYKHPFSGPLLPQVRLVGPDALWDPTVPKSLFRSCLMLMSCSHPVLTAAVQCPSNHVSNPPAGHPNKCESCRIESTIVKGQERSSKLSRPYGHHAGTGCQTSAGHRSPQLPTKLPAAEHGSHES